MVRQWWVGLRSDQSQQEGVRLLLRQEAGPEWAGPELVRGEGEVPDQVLTATRHPPHTLLGDGLPQPGAPLSRPPGESRGEVQLGVDM